MLSGPEKTDQPSEPSSVHVLTYLYHGFVNICSLSILAACLRWFICARSDQSG